MGIFGKKLHFYFITVLGLTLLAYTIVRAATLSMTHDESLTFLWFVPESFMQIVSYYQPNANNHIINTLLIKLFTSIIPVNEFVVRLPNIIAHLTYLIFSYLILKRFKSPLFIICGFILMNFNPYLLDFFSLARGYGLSMAFMILSLYFLFRYSETKTQKDTLYTFIFAALSVLSNFVLLYFYLSLLIIYNLWHLYKKENWSKIFRINVQPLIITIVLAIILFEPIRKLSKFNKMYIGGKTGFFHDTIMSLVNGSKYGVFYPFDIVNLISVSILGIVIIALLIIAIHFIKNHFIFSYSKIILFSGFLILPALFSILQHYILGSNYLTYRMGLFFIPLFRLFITAFFHSFLQFKVKYIASSLMVVVSLFAIYHTFKAANFSHFSDWEYDANTKSMITDLEKSYKNSGSNQKISLGINWLFEPSINFYRETKKLNWLNEVTRDGISGNYDFYYIFSDQIQLVQKNKIIHKYKTSNTVLMKRLEYNTEF